MSETIERAVRDQYGAIAASGLSNDDAGARAIAEAFGYSAEELSSAPAEANMGLSCGNPTAIASLRPGEVVVDLGCGGGLDVFLAADKVGPTGKVVGIDMTPEMIARATQNARQANVNNVEFHQATIDNLPLPEDFADCVISNCVINLAADKTAVFREMFRVLKPGGRVAVSDIALKRDLPAELGQDLGAYVGCIAGAIRIADYEAGLRAAGFDSVRVLDSGADLNAYKTAAGRSGCCVPSANSESAPAIKDQSCCGPTCCGGEKADIRQSLSNVLDRFDVNAFAASVKVLALKPQRA